MKIDAVKKRLSFQKELPRKDSSLYINILTDPKRERDHLFRIILTAPYIPASFPRTASLKSVSRAAWNAAGL